MRRKLDALRRGQPDDDQAGEPPAPGAQVDDEVHRAVRNLRERARERRLRPVRYERDLPRHEPRRGPSRPSGNPVTLEDATEGEVVDCPGGGKAWLVTQRLSDMGAEWEAIAQQFAQALARPDSPVRRRMDLKLGAVAGRLEDVIFLDLETTGLGNSPVFLIGAMEWREGTFEVRQLFARDYSEERAILGLYREALRPKQLLVSFNGKTFDVPFVRTRAIARGVPKPKDAPHFDLLHECRRIWRECLPDCRLQTLEHRICGRLRFGDIPGAEIPEAYHAFVRTADAWQMVEVLKHNMLDLITMADLMTRFPGDSERGTGM